MIIYNETKNGFMRDFEKGNLIGKLDTLLSQRLRHSALNEIMSWRNSLSYMYMVMNDQEIPDESGVAIEYVIPTSAKRIDFLITGYDSDNCSNAVIIELKQWSRAELVEDKEDIVETAINHGIREVLHPSYQAWSYAALLTDFNETVQNGIIKLHPCAYLHNYRRRVPNDPITDEHYSDILGKAPLFDGNGVNELRKFIKSFVRKGDQRKTLYELENGKIRPSKSLQDSLASMLNGNPEFTLIDEQKLVFERAISMAEKTRLDDIKRVFIVEGGPGTGKSVVAIRLLSELLSRGMTCHYISKNSAPREVYKTKLKGNEKANSVDNLFKGSGSYFDMIEGTLDVAIVDEAHRLNAKSGFYSNQGENQIKEIIHASKVSIFFIDEDQRISLADIGTIEDIKKYAKLEKAHIYEDELVSQFRCNGSAGYIAWLDDVLHIRETANPIFDLDYDFGVVDDPNELMNWVRQKNENNKSRMLAGYCWEWPTDERRNASYSDIQITDKDFEISWNLNGQIWAIDPDSVEQAGCIHTSQGLEFEYVGVIIGPDMSYKNGHVITDVDKRASSDMSIKGIKKMKRESPEKAERIAERIIKNTYRTLMTRGMKGCRVYCTDESLSEYLKSRSSPTVFYDASTLGNLIIAEEPEDYNV